VKKITLYIIFYLLYLTVLLRAQDQFLSIDPLRQEKQFIPDGKDIVYVLDHRFLIPGSIHIHLDTLIQKQEIDYQVNFQTGEISFRHPPSRGSFLNIIYRHLPVDLKAEYSHRTASDSMDLKDSTIMTIPKRKLSAQKTQRPYGDELRRSGSIFRGISLGTNQGMRLQSGLRLQVSGKIAQNIEVVASLTDQNTPIQPEGNTQTLQEIDKVFINLKAPGFRATLGDYVYNVDGSNFSTYSRKLQGAMGRIDGSFWNMTMMASASKGEFTTNNLNGQEANQGPYQLKGTSGQREIIVLAGTERVWIDGELMTRGEDNDYVIEYGLGQITFSRNRLITGDSRITVDFEYSDQKFQKGIYGAVGEINLWDNRFKFRSSFLREADDKENPMDIPITDEYKDVLRNAGDNPDSALVSGANKVDKNEGNYIQTEIDGNIVYQYTGKDSGDYNVRFSYVGPDQGDYSFQGYGIYRYEGPRQGSYLPFIYLPLARSHQMIDFKSSIEPIKGIYIDGEIGISDQDLNLYSSKGDGDNVDIAYTGSFKITEKPVRVLNKSLGQFGMDAKIRKVGDRFRPVGRIADVEYGRKWGTQEGVFWGEKVVEFQSSYRPFKTWMLKGEYGNFERQNFNSERKMITTELSQSKLPLVKYTGELIETTSQLGNDGYWLRQQGSIKAELFGFQNTFKYEGEHRRDQSVDSIKTGFRFDEWSGILLYKKGRFLSEISETIRNDKKYELGSLEKYSLARTDKVRFDLQISRNLNSSLMFTHRVRDYNDAALKDQKSDLADGSIRFYPGNRAFESTINYRFSSTQISEMVKDTIKVGEGLGNYRYDENLKELIPDPDGDILYRTIQTGTFLPINDLKTGLELRINGSKMWKTKKGLKEVLGAIKTRSLVRIERRDKERNFFEVNKSAFNPRWGRDTTTVTGVFSLLQDLDYTSLNGFSVRLRYRKNDSENYQLVREGTIRHVTEKSVRIKGSPASKLGILIEYQNKDEDKEYTNRPYSNRDIRAHYFTAEISFRPKQEIELALKTKISRAKDVFPDPVTEATSLFFHPRFSYSFKRKGHLRTELEFGNVRSSPADRTLPYEMLRGDQTGRTFRLTVLLTYRVSGHILATLNYRGRKEPWRKEYYQTGQVEVRAYF
jgi:hypothetical protein